MSSSLFLLLFLLLLGCFESSYSSSIGIEIARRQSRSILRAINSPDLVDHAIELNISNFDQVLKESPSSSAIVEFFAHWCPACRNYKPHYEKVARLFNGPDAVHPGIILMTRVDCALKVNTKLCDRFSVGRYPMLLWGPPSKFASGGWEPKQDKSEIQSIDDGRTADRLLNWINNRIGRAFNLEDEKYETEHPHLNASDPGQIAQAIYDVEEATAKAFEIILEHKMIKSETRASLIKFFQLLVAHHPSKRCRRGSAEILMNFDYLWPSDLWSVFTQENVISHERDALNTFRICGKDVPYGYWTFCHGSKNDTRGFSCGLWVLLHSLSVRVEDGESNSAFTAMCQFIHNFFICEECRQHFYKMCSSVSAPFNNTKDFALWLWSAHNNVNERLMKEEASLGTGDPRFPKMMWPPKQLCPSCYLSPGVKLNGTIQIEWNKDEVFKFLVSYYGKMLVSTSKEKGVMEAEIDSSTAGGMAISTTGLSSTVPFGAALAIALACCAFAVLTCLWRSQQKNRKPRRSRNGDFSKSKPGITIN